MRRRTFMGTAVAGVGAASAAEQTSVKPGNIPVRTFGRTGEKLTIIGVAGGRFPLINDFDEAVALVRRAYDLGINYFDNAHLYWGGKSEEVFGAALAPFRKKVFITTKSAERSRAGAEKDLAQSFRSMKTDYIDLWQIHQVGEMSEVDQIFGPGGAIEAFEAARKAGKCRFIGFTGHRDPAVHLEMLKRYNKYDTILMPLNPADPAYLSFEKQVLPVAVERGMGIQGMKSLANAKMLPAMSVKDCLSYVLSLPIHCLALGCTSTGQLEDDVRIAQQFKKLEADQMAAIRKRAERLKGPGTEDWKRNTERAGGALHVDG